MKARYISLKPFLLWRQAGRSIDWRQEFGRDAPLEIEIGFGNGDFLVRRAEAYPERNFVGIEVEWPSVRRALRRIAQAELGNARLLMVDAQIALERVFLPRSLHRVYALFPCPWPKERQAKYRLFSHDFLRLLNNRLVKGGEAQVVTDHRAYLDWVLEQVPGCGFEFRCQEIPPRYGTKYENKWHRQGQEQFFELNFLKIEHIATPGLQEIIIAPARVSGFDPERFQPADQLGDITVQFKEFLYDPDWQKGMVRVIIVEGHMIQHLWIEIVWDGGGWRICPSPGCANVYTAGLRRALELVCEAAA